jgi:hypothetical protein
MKDSHSERIAFSLGALAYAAHGALIVALYRFGYVLLAIGWALALGIRLLGFARALTLLSREDKPE